MQQCMLSRQGEVLTLWRFPLFFPIPNPVERVDNTGDDISGMTGNALQEAGVQGNSGGIRAVETRYRSRQNRIGYLFAGIG